MFAAGLWVLAVLSHPVVCGTKTQWKHNIAKVFQNATVRQFRMRRTFGGNENTTAGKVGESKTKMAKLLNDEQSRDGEVQLCPLWPSRLWSLTFQSFSKFTQKGCSEWEQTHTHIPPRRELLFRAVRSSTRRRASAALNTTGSLWLNLLYNPVSAFLSHSLPCRL